MKLTYLFLVCILLASLSCTKEKSCFSTSADDIVVEQYLSPIKKLIVKDIINLHLLSDTVNKVFISGAENLVEGIDIKQNDSIVEIYDNNKCKYLRKLDDRIDVFLHFKNLREIVVEAPCAIKSDDTINVEALSIIVYSRIIDIDLAINCDIFDLWNNPSTGTLKLSGEVGRAFVGVYHRVQLFAENFHTNHLMIESDSEADCYINGKNKLSVTIKNIGNIYHHYQPSELIINDTLSTGKLRYIN